MNRSLQGLGLPALIAVIVGAIGVGWVLEGMRKGKDLAMRQVPTVSGAGWIATVPEGFLLVDDPRVEVPPGGIALASARRERRSTITIVPYPDDNRGIFTAAGCTEVARLHGIQVGAAAKRPTVTAGSNRRRCNAELEEGTDVAGAMLVVELDGHPVMVTCRYRREHRDDAQACQDIAASVTAAPSPGAAKPSSAPIGTPDGDSVR